MQCCQFSREVSAAVRKGPSQKPSTASGDRSGSAIPRWVSWHLPAGRLEERPRNTPGQQPVQPADDQGRDVAVQLHDIHAPHSGGMAANRSCRRSSSRSVSLMAGCYPYGTAPVKVNLEWVDERPSWYSEKASPSRGDIHSTRSDRRSLSHRSFVVNMPENPYSQESDFQLSCLKLPVIRDWEAACTSGSLSGGQRKPLRTPRWS